MVSFKHKLNKTFQSDIYYTDFDNLPSTVKDFIMKEYLSLYEIENSSYTVFRDTLYIRHTATIEGVSYDLELTIGDLMDEHPDGSYETNEELEQAALDMLDYSEWHTYNVYLTV